jgi:ubiquinone biosynthesis protein UbiJ
MIQGLLLAGLNHLLRQAAWARRHLQPFAGRQARFLMPPWSLGLTVGADGLAEASASDAAPDVLVALPAGGPLLALQGLERLLAEAHVTGNAEFATALSFVLKNLRWDAEEDLSAVFGDVTAHRLASGVRTFVGWQRQAAGRLVENMAGYLKDEAALLVPAGELAEMGRDLARLNEDLGKLQARLTALSR